MVALRQDAVGHTRAEKAINLMKNRARDATVFALNPCSKRCSRFDTPGLSNRIPRGHEWCGRSLPHSITLNSSPPGYRLCLELEQPS